MVILNQCYRYMACGWYTYNIFKLVFISEWWCVTYWLSYRIWYNRTQFLIHVITKYILFLEKAQLLCNYCYDLNLNVLYFNMFSIFETFFHTCHGLQISTSTKRNNSMNEAFRSWKTVGEIGYVWYHGMCGTVGRNNNKRYLTISN